LGFHHLDGHGLELLEPRRAAELAAAHAHAPGDARLVAGPDLLHLDAGADRLSELARQVAQLDLVVGRDEDGGARAVVRRLHLDELRGQSARPYRAKRGRAELALLLQVLVLASELPRIGFLDDPAQMAARRPARRAD